MATTFSAFANLVAGGVLAVTGTNAYTSQAFVTGSPRFNANWGATLFTTGTPNGSLETFVTMDSDDAIAAGTARWLKYTLNHGVVGGTAISFSGGTGTINGVHSSALTLANVVWRAFRFVYTNASGSGTLEILVNKVT